MVSLFNLGGIDGEVIKLLIMKIRFVIFYLINRWNIGINKIGKNMGKLYMIKYTKVG